MMDAAQRARIRRLFYAEHWKIGTISSELGVHHDAVRNAIESDRFVSAGTLVRPTMLDPYKGLAAKILDEYPRVPEGIVRQAAYRLPDRIRGGTWEAFERVLNTAGYFAGGLQKIAAARAIAAHMDMSRNASPSFGKLRDVLLEMSSSQPSSQ